MYTHTCMQSLIEGPFAPTNIWGDRNMDLFQYTNTHTHTHTYSYMHAEFD